MKWIIAVVVAAAVLQVASCNFSVEMWFSEKGERYTHSKESMRDLWRAMDAAEASRAAEGGIPAVCSHRALPEGFKPMCRDPNAIKLFTELEELRPAPRPSAPAVEKRMLPGPKQRRQ